MVTVVGAGGQPVQVPASSLNLAGNAMNTLGALNSSTDAAGRYIRRLISIFVVFLEICYKSNVTKYFNYRLEFYQLAT